MVLFVDLDRSVRARLTRFIKGLPPSRALSSTEVETSRFPNFHSPTLPD